MCWTQLESVPFECRDKIVGSVTTNNHKITIIAQSGIYEYDTNCNEYTKIIDYPPNDVLFASMISISFCILSENEEILYLCDTIQSYLISINLTNKKWKISSKHDHFGHAGCRGIIIHNKLNIICGGYNNKHLRYDESEGFKEIFEFKEFEHGLLIPEIIHVKSKNMALMFGGIEHNNNSKTFYDTIYQFDFNKNKWIKLEVSMPRCLSHFGITTAINNQYILIFGGYDAGEEYHHKKILVYSLLTGTIRESKVKCPEISDRFYFRAVTINKKEESELTVYGYIRHQWRLCGISEHQFPPTYLIQVISSWYLEEYIHLIDKDNNNHWRISSLDIV